MDVIPFFPFALLFPFAFFELKHLFPIPEFSWGQWTSRRREERDSEFAPPSTYYPERPITTEPKTKGRAKETLPSSGLNPKNPQTETQTTYLPLDNLLTYPHMHNLLKHRVWTTCYRTTNTPHESSSLKII